MTARETYLLVSSVFGAFVLLGAWQFVFLPSMLDDYRHSIFCLRRELLLLVARKELKVTDPAFLLLWDSFNGLIRLAERVNASFGILANIAHPRGAEAFDSMFSQALEQLEPDMRQKIDDLYLRSVRVVAAQFLRSSPLAWGILLFLSPAIILIQLLTMSIVPLYRRLSKRISSGVQDLAVAEGQAA